MKTLTLFVLGVLPCAAFASDEGGRAFGKALTLSEPVALAAALERPQAYAEKEVLLEARVNKVCRKKGCWMMLREGKDYIRVTFEGYEFFVPKDSAGKRVRAQGRLVSKTLSVREARHFLKDEGASRAEIRAVKKPVETVEFVASGVEFIEDVTAPHPPAPAAPGPLPRGEGKE